MDEIRSTENYVWFLSCELGRGAFGSVYKGIHKETGTEVAVKVFNKCNQARSFAVQLREFEVMKAISHDNIVKVIATEDEMHTQNPRKVLIMEFCSGGNLQTILEDPQNINGLEEEEFLCVLKDFTAGLQYLRINSIVHRDLKPGNILKCISEDGRSIYKLADFGSARILHDDEEFCSMHGTELYLAPDMFKAFLNPSAEKAYFGATVDLWSIGATIYQLATGSLPFLPYGGKRNRRTMLHIVECKQSGVISGVQHFANGPIAWSTELPATCLLNKGLRDLITSVLAGVLECDVKKQWTFDQFFEHITDIINRKVFHIFFVNEGKEISLYIQPHKMLQDLKDEIFAHTQVLPTSQLLLFGKTYFLSQIHPSSTAFKFPTTTLDQPLVLVHIEENEMKDQMEVINKPVQFKFPPYCPNTIVKSASICCSQSFRVKRFIVKLVRCQERLLQFPKNLISLSVENVTKLCSDLDGLKLKMDDLNYRCELLEETCIVLSNFVSAWPNVPGHEDFLNSARLICDGIKALVAEKIKHRNKLKMEIFQLQSSVVMVKQRILVSDELQNREQMLSNDCCLVRCVEMANTYMRNIHKSWKTILKLKSTHVYSVEKQEHQVLERLKMKNSNRKLIVLQDECRKVFLKTYAKLNEWYSGAQVLMVQCKCLREVLESVNDNLLSFSSSLQQRECKIFKLASQVTTADFCSAVSQPNHQIPNHYKENFLKVQNCLELQEDITESIKENISLTESVQNCLELQEDVKESIKENISLTESLVSFIQTLPADLKNFE